MININVDVFIIAVARQCLTLDELARKAGVGKATISRIINRKGKTTLVVIGKLAKALDISIESLIIE